MFNHVTAGIQRAFFDSLEQAGCLKLETENPDSSDDEEEDDDVGGSQDEDEDGDKDDSESVEDGDHGTSASDNCSEPELLEVRVVGFGSFLRKNPKTDKFTVERVHHIELWCPDATNTALRFSWALGVPMVAKSELATGNHLFTSYALKCGEILLCLSAPQSSFSAVNPAVTPRVPFPAYKQEVARKFIARHGVAVRALAVEVSDVLAAYSVSILNGATGIAEPIQITDPATGSSVWLAEVALLGDVVLRFVNLASGTTAFLPYFDQATNHVMSYGLNRLDHAVGAVGDLQDTLQYIKGFTGFHEFDEEVGTPNDAEEKSPLASKGPQKLLDYAVLANNSETVLIPLIGSGPQQQVRSRVSQFLDANGGPGIQHLALMCTDIVQTVQEMKARSGLGGLQFNQRPSAKYYKDLTMRLGSKLSQQQLDKYKELGILVDVDDRGVLLQIFTKPICDRLSLSLEIVQRISHKGGNFPNVGCGGFGVRQVVPLDLC